MPCWEPGPTRGSMWFREVQDPGVRSVSGGRGASGTLCSPQSGWAALHLPSVAPSGAQAPHLLDASQGATGGGHRGSRWKHGGL